MPVMTLMVGRVGIVQFTDSQDPTIRGNSSSVREKEGSFSCVNRRKRSTLT